MANPKVCGLTCKPIMYIHEGPQLSFDERHAFRYEVRDEQGAVVGFINTDRARSHPDVKWKRELLIDGNIQHLDRTYKTVDDAFAAF
jgi:hypothetical protein